MTTELHCKKCGSPMQPGKAIAQTVTGMPDFPGDKSAVTLSAGGPGVLIDCMKCVACGWSMTVPTEREALIKRLRENHHTWRDTIDRCCEAADMLADTYDQQSLELCEVCGWKGIIPGEPCLVCARGVDAQWQTAVLDELTASCMSYPAGTAPREMLRGLIDYRVQMALDPSMSEAAAQQDECSCDERGIGEPGVTCGDCPRDYQQQVAVLAVCKKCGAPQGTLHMAHTGCGWPRRVVANDCEQVAVPQGLVHAHTADIDKSRKDALGRSTMFIAALQSPQQSSISAEALSFLRGEGSLDGVWFGEDHPTEREKFWWRKHLVAASQPPQAETTF